LNADSGVEVEIEVGMSAAKPADIDDGLFPLLRRGWRRTRMIGYGR
jgi:hypothetical protein